MQIGEDASLLSLCPEQALTVPPQSVTNTQTIPPRSPRRETGGVLPGGRRWDWQGSTVSVTPLTNHPAKSMCICIEEDTNRTFILLLRPLCRIAGIIFDAYM